MGDRDLREIENNKLGREVLGDNWEMIQEKIQTAVNQRVLYRLMHLEEDIDRAIERHIETVVLIGLGIDTTFGRVEVNSNSVLANGISNLASGRVNKILDSLNFDDVLSALSAESQRQLNKSVKDHFERKSRELLYREADNIAEKAVAVQLKAMATAIAADISLASVSPGGFEHSLNQASAVRVAADQKNR